MFPSAFAMAEARDARFVMASLASYDTTHGGPLFDRRGVSIASKLAGQVIAVGCLGFKLRWTNRQEPREGTMTLEISQRGKQYLKTAQTLLRAAKTMTNQAVASQLKALADDYERRAEKASCVDAAKALARATAEAESELLFERGWT
jgi:hypothetical protein